MLLTLTCYGPEAPDFSSMLHKSNIKLHTFKLDFAVAKVFYPVVCPEKVSCAMMLEIDPLTTAKENVGFPGLFDYLSDRPYAANSFMSLAIPKIFGTSMAGLGEDNQQAADQILDLEATISVLPCQEDTKTIKGLFAPLGYQVSWESSLLDENFPDWGRSPYIKLTIRGRVRLRDLLTHLYVLIPVFDERKHYWIGNDEVERILKSGEGWLDSHPLKTHIAYRYDRSQSPGKAAPRRPDLGESGTSEEDQDAEQSTTAKPQGPSKVRLAAVLEELAAAGAKSVVEFCCGDGKLLLRLRQTEQFEWIVGVDVSLETLKLARERFNKAFKELPDNLTLIQGAPTYFDSNLTGIEAAVCQDVFERLNAWKLPVFEKILFGALHPATVILTAAIKDGGVKGAPPVDGKLPTGGSQPVDGALPADGDPPLQDGGFEWTSADFARWTQAVSSAYGYAATVKKLADKDPRTGRRSQMGVFKKC
jgi:3' terminal RNA ribose 2'-O-methyltransferase Hen1